MTTPTGGVTAPTEADYAHAAGLLPGNLQGLVRNEAVEPHWLGDHGRFWYRRDGDTGREFVVVAPDGARTMAFDHAAVEGMLAKALGEDAPDGPVLDALVNVRLAEDLGRLSAQVGAKQVECDLVGMQVSVADAPATPWDRLPSPDGRREAFRRDDNLFVLDTASGEERRLTHDGAPYYSWAKMPDNCLGAVVLKKLGSLGPMWETSWSPDSRYLLCPRLDERRVGVNPVVEWVPTDGSLRPKVHEVRIAFVGDQERAQADYFIFDLETGRCVPIPLPSEYQPDLLSIFGGRLLGWSRGGAQVFLVAQTTGSRCVSVFRVDLATGAVAKVLDESSSTRVQMNSEIYNGPNARLIGDGSEIVWFSDRTGWGHLYLYDAQTGAMKNAITAGDWLVLDVLSLDEARREIYFTGLGREPGRDPYFRHLYRASLDGSSEITLLTEPDADHHFASASPTLSARMVPYPANQIHPAADRFVDTWSRVDSPPVSVLRSTRDGRVIAELERADAARLFAAGWKAPSRERVLAADGETALYAVYFAPRGGADADKRPVIDAVYGGPQITVAPRNFLQAYRGSFPFGQASLAHFGFAVVTIDARGTPSRSSAFRDAGYPEFGKVGVDDHVAAIQELAGRHPELDATRLGVYGWSWGGSFSAQAILGRPDVYKVAVSGAGAYDYAGLYVGMEPWNGLPEYGDGSMVRATAGEVPTNWDKTNITLLAERLEGHLLIAYADMDENVPPLQAKRLVAALTKANKPYDLICLPGRTHRSASESYMIKRTWDYFLEHLMNVAPVRDFRIEQRPLAPG